jgi:hypothetical protein
MDLSESDSTVDYKNALPSLVLPNPDSKKKITTKISKKAMLKEIKSLLKDMKKNDRRTTNFAIILYLVENKIDKISFSDLLSEIKEQFKDKSKIFISSSMKKPFETQKSLVFSVVSSINRNHSFKVERNEKKKERYISLIPENALKYLRKMYKKYTSDNADIASISSEKSDDRFACQSEKKNTSFKFLGNKTVKKKIKKEKKQFKLKDKSFDSSIDSIDSDNEEVKYLKDNLKGKPAKDSDSLNIIFNNENMSQEEIDDDIFNKDFSSRINNNITNFDSNPKNEIHNHISIVEENEKFLGSYKRSLQKVESKIEEKEKAMKKLDENKDNVKGLKNDLKTMHKILELKLKIVKNTTKNKYFGDTFEKNRINALAYKKISDSKIEDLKKGLKEIEALEKDIISKNKEIVNEFEKMKITDTGNKCFCKKEVNEDCNNLLKKIKEDNKIIENCDDDGDFSNENKNNGIVNVIVEKLNDLSSKIEEEKEEF